MFNAVKLLELRRFVKLVGKKQTSKGTTANVYDLALQGVLFVLERELATVVDTKPRLLDDWTQDQIREVGDRIHKIIRKYEFLLPLIFGKWSYFREFGVEGEALFRLKTIVDIRNRLGFYDYEPAEVIEKEIIVRRIYSFFFFRGLMPETLEFNGWKIAGNPNLWMNMWKHDDEIKAYLVKELMEYQERLGEIGSFVNGTLSFLQA